MNARVLLLVLVTAMFMAAWDGDGKAEQKALARLDQQRQALIAQKSSEASVPVTLQHRKARVKGREAADESSAVAPPLPEAIAAGKYQVVGQNGQTVRMTVTRKQASSRHPRDLYFVDDSSGTRWVFVRIQAD